MYCILALVMLLRGFSDAIMMRAQQALAAGGAQRDICRPSAAFNRDFSLRLQHDHDFVHGECHSW